MESHDGWFRVRGRRSVPMVAIIALTSKQWQRWQHVLFVACIAPVGDQAGVIEFSPPNFVMTFSGECLAAV